MTAQLDLSFRREPTLDPVLDGPRIARALDLVLEALCSGGWWTLKELAEYAKCSEAGASARWREIVASRLYITERQRVPGARGLWRYRIMDPTPDYPRAA